MLYSPRQDRECSILSKFAKFYGHYECNSYLIVFIIVLNVYSLSMVEKEPFIGLRKGDFGVIFLCDTV